MSRGASGAWIALGRDKPADRSRISRRTLRRIAGFAAPYRHRLAAFLALIVVAALSGAATPLVFREVVDGGILEHDAGRIVDLSLVLVLLAISDGGLRVWQRRISARIGQGLVFDLRSKVFAHIQRMPIAFFTRVQTGALISRLNNDVLGAQRAFTDTFSAVVSNLLTIIITLVVMLALSWQITLGALAMTPLFVLPTRWMAKRLGTVSRAYYDVISELNSAMTERFNVAGALLVKLFGRTSTETRAFRQRAGRVRDIGVTQGTYAGYLMGSLTLTASLSTALVLGWGGILAARHALPVGTVIALAAYLNQLYGPLTALSNVQVDVVTALVSFDRVFEVLDLPPMIAEKPDAVPIPRRPATVDFEHVTFGYPAGAGTSLPSLEPPAAAADEPPRDVLTDVSFTATPGQLIALVGPSGAGKTTISMLIPRLYDVQSGAVRVNGVDVRDATLDSLQAAIGVISQDPHLFHDTIRANLQYAKPDATEDELLAALRSAQLSSLVESLPDRLDTVVGDCGYKLSGGEKQRIAIARLLLRSPDIVILDEATAHLDAESETAVQHALKASLADRTSVVIAHRLSTVREADLILVLAEGRIVEQGSHADLVTANGLYANLYAAQFNSPSPMALEPL